MASVKNSARSKRKYGDKQKARTEKNRAARKARHERKLARMNARTDSLVGTPVHFGSKAEGPKVGTVVSVVRTGEDGYPVRTSDFKPRGAYLIVNADDGEHKLSRRGVKPVRS